MINITYYNLPDWIYWMTCFGDMLCHVQSIRASTPRSCLWRLMDARLHLVDADWADGIGTKRSNASNYTKLSPSFQLPKNSLVVPSNPKRLDLLILLAISWDVLKACPGPQQLANLHMTAQALASAGLAWLRFSQKAKHKHSESWGKLQFLIPAQKSNTHGRNRTEQNLLII